MFCTVRHSTGCGRTKISCYCFLKVRFAFHWCNLFKKKKTVLYFKLNNCPVRTMTMTMKLIFLPMMMMISIVAVAAKRFQRLVGKCNNQQFQKKMAKN